MAQASRPSSSSARPIGAGTWTNQTASWNTTAQTDGQYDLRVVTTDNAGNVFSSAPITVRVDNTNPTGSVTAPAAAANLRATVALASSSADSGSGVATVQFQRSPIGAGTWTNQAASWNTTLQADGQYDLRVVTTDNAGNSFTSAAVTVRVDNTLPTGSITAPAAGAEIGVPPVSLTSNAADAGSGLDTVTFQRSPAGAGTWTATPSTWDTATGANAVADGSYDLRVVATDLAGNVFTSAAVTVLVDHTAPTTSALLAPGSPSNAPVTVSFSAGDGTGSGVSKTEYRVDGGSLLQGSSVIIPAPGDHSNDGTHTVAFFSTDDVGNVEAPANTVNVVIDTTAPSGSGGDPGDYLRGIANLSYSTGATDVSSVQFQFSPAGANSWANIGAADISPPYEASWSTTLVADGEYDLRAVVTDTTGNVANELLPGLPKTVDNTAGERIDHLARRCLVRRRQRHGHRQRLRRPRPARLGRLGSPLRDQAHRRRRLHGLRHADDTDGRLDLQPVARDRRARRRSRRPPGRRHRRRRQRDNVRDAHDQHRQPRPRRDARRSGRSSRLERRPHRKLLARHHQRGLPLPRGRKRRRRHADRFGQHRAVRSHLDDRTRGRDAVGADRGRHRRRRKHDDERTRVVLVDRTLPTGNVTAPGSGDTVGGPAVALGANAADLAGSGVISVVWEVMEFGSASFAPVATDTDRALLGHLELDELA